jgi:molybdenum-dependent DNA-binding transcriptional regulator ModE
MDQNEIGKHTRVIGEDREQLLVVIAERYMNGESIRAMAQSMGRSYGFVHRMVKEAGCTMRSRGGARSNKAKASA